MSWPPASRPFRTRGDRSARAAYKAAVNQAGPDPITITSRTSSTVRGILPHAPTVAYSRGRDRSELRPRGAQDLRAVVLPHDEHAHGVRGLAGPWARQVHAEERRRALEARVHQPDQDTLAASGPAEARGRSAERRVVRGGHRARPAFAQREGVPPAAVRASEIGDRHRVV